MEGRQPVDLTQHPSRIVPTLHELILQAIVLQARNAESNPKVCTGAKREQLSKLAARKYARIVQKLGFPAKFKVLSYSLVRIQYTLYFSSERRNYIYGLDFKIQNIVGSCHVKFPIRLEGLAYSHSAFSSVSDNLKNYGSHGDNMSDDSHTSLNYSQD
ncbi:hypothetical protein YC2023_076100 [Brassica napus]